MPFNSNPPPVAPASIHEPQPSLTDALVSLFEQQFPQYAGRVGTKFAEDLSTNPRWIRIAIIGGSQSQIECFPVLDVHTFASTYREAELLAWAINGLLLSYPLVMGRLVLTDATVGQIPNDVPWDDPKVRRFVATYQLSIS